MKKIYVEAGANDGLFQSCTLELEKTGKWRGILIEPNINAYNQCLINRSADCNVFYNCALVSTDYDSDVIDFFNHAGHTAMGGIIKRTDTSYLNCIKVKCKTLQTILNECGVSFVDKFFLDVEGYELNVLKGIDFKKTIINEIELEVHAKSVVNYKDNGDEKAKIVEFLTKNNFSLREEYDPGDANIKLNFIYNKE